LPALCACALVATLAWRRRLVWALAAAPLLYAAILQVELPNLEALWIAPRVETLLKATWPAWSRLGAGLVVAGYAEPSLMFLAGTKLQLVPDGAQAAIRLARGQASAALVSGRDEPAFAAQLAGLGVSPRAAGEVTGFNYTRGRWVTLELFTR
jgi:hypothetical protein